MQDRFQCAAGLVIGKHALAQGRAVEPAIGLQHVGAEARADFHQRRLARFHQLAGQHVGIQHRHAQCREGAVGHALAGGDPAGQPDPEMRHPRSPRIGGHARARTA